VSSPKTASRKSFLEAEIPANDRLFKDLAMPITVETSGDNFVHGTVYVRPIVSGTDTGPFSFQWQAAATSGGSYQNITGATFSSYKIGQELLPARPWIRCVVTYVANGEPGSINGPDFGPLQPARGGVGTASTNRSKANNNKTSINKDADPVHQPSPVLRRPIVVDINNYPRFAANQRLRNV
jgi:hypothetical protein